MRIRPFMTVNINEQLIRDKQKSLALLMRKFQASMAQKDRALSDSEKVSLGEESNQLWIQVEKMQAEINALEAFQSSYRKRAQLWEEDFYKIDFSEVESVLTPIFKKLKRKEGSALFLLPKSGAMGGKWCLQKIKSQIQSDLGNRIASCEIGFPSFQSANSSDFLNRMAETFSMEPPSAGNTQNAISDLLDSIANSLTSGNIFLLQVNIYALTPQDSFLNWFVNDFWLPLISRLPVISSKHTRVRLISVVSVQGPIPSDCLAGNICCERTAMNGGKLLALPLQAWTEDEICDWLFDFSGLLDQANPLANDEIEQMARNIHGVTEGIPKDVYHALIDVMTQRAC